MNPYGNILIRVASDLGNCFHEIYTITTSNTQLYPGNHAQGRALTNEKWENFSLAKAANTVSPFTSIWALKMACFLLATNITLILIGG